MLSSRKVNRVRRKMRSVSKRSFSKSRLSKGRTISKRLSRRGLKSKLSRKFTKVGGKSKLRSRHKLTKCRQNNRRNNRKTKRRTRFNKKQSGGTIAQIKTDLKKLKNIIYMAHNDHYIFLINEENPIEDDRIRIAIDHFLKILTLKTFQPPQVAYVTSSTMRPDFNFRMDNIIIITNRIIQLIESYIQNQNETIESVFTPTPSLFEDYMFCKKVKFIAIYLSIMKRQYEIDQIIKHIYTKSSDLPIDYFSKKDTWKLIKPLSISRSYINDILMLIERNIRLFDNYNWNDDDTLNYEQDLIAFNIIIDGKQISNNIKKSIIEKKFIILNAYRTDFKAILEYFKKTYATILGQKDELLGEIPQEEELPELPEVPTHPVDKAADIKAAREKAQKEAQANEHMITLMKLMDQTQDIPSVMKKEYVDENTQSFYLKKFNEITNNTYKNKFDFSKQNKGQIHIKKGKRDWNTKYRHLIETFKKDNNITHFFELM